MANCREARRTLASAGVRYCDDGRDFPASGNISEQKPAKAKKHRTCIVGRIPNVDGRRGIVTVNEYLVATPIDAFAHSTAPPYRTCPRMRSARLMRDVTHATNNELGFD
jgi:hypothetical protein